MPQPSAFSASPNNLLLDYDDAYGIGHAAFYLSRQAGLIGWKVEDFLGLLGARHDLPTLRAACRRALNGDGPPPLPAGALRRPGPGSSPPVQDSLFDTTD